MSERKTVVIVGAGIAGLAAGVYAARSGFRAIIAESHNIPGGCSTSWHRSGYLFEGGMHWLNGSSPESGIHRLWRETGALNDATNILVNDPFLACDYEGTRVCCWRDVDRFEAHLREISPADEKAIAELCAVIRRFIKIRVPVMNLPGLKAKTPSDFSLAKVWKMLPALLSMPRLNKTSVSEYVKRFKSPAIRLLLSSVVNPDYDLVSFFYILGCFMAGDGGYVEGGSLKMSQNMADYFQNLGGELRLKCKAEKVVVENGVAKGVLAGASGGSALAPAVSQECIPADAVIVAADILGSGARLFDPPLAYPWLSKMKRERALVVNTFFCFGVNAELPDIPEVCVFPVEPFEYAGSIIREIPLSNYYGFEGYAPPGCSALTARIRTDSYDYWKQAKADGTYQSKKEALFETVLERIEKQYPALKGKTAVRDVATPLTYERYTGNVRGAWMTKVLPGQKRAGYPCKPQGIARLYLAGHRLYPPGGMPPALFTGRTAAMHLCRDAGAVFV
jgi:phytoene dehydrogenase-like protein